jgi:CzcA family heavy metal efflux pump
MLGRLIAWSLGNPLLVLAGAAALLVWGAWTASRSPVDVLPDLAAPTVTVIAEAHGMAPEDVERQITIPIEVALNGAAGVRRVRSSTGVGLTVITAEFEWGTDLYRARQVVAENLQAARAELPPGLPAPVIEPVASIMGEILFIALRSDVHDEMALKTAADWVVRRRLRAVPGVAAVIPIGGETRQYQVLAEPERLAAYGITLAELREAVAATSRNASAGFIAENRQEFLIQGLGLAADVAALETAVVALRGDVPVLVRDLATVQTGPAPRRGTGSYSGTPAVVLGIQKQPEVNTLALTERLDAVVDELRATLPAGMTLDTDAFRQADFITTAIDNLTAALRDAAVLVTVILFVFLLSARATVIGLLAIPLSLVVAVLVIRWFGGTINTMTLGGMAIALGVLVDDAIIVVENIVRRLRENHARPEPQQRSAHAVVLAACREIERPMLFANLIIALVFVPLFFLGGFEGRLLEPLGLAYVVALAASLLVAFTVTPVLCLRWLPGTRSAVADHDTAFVRALKRGYRPLLEAALRRWWAVAGVSLVLLAGAVLALAASGRAFLPEFNEGSLTVGVVTLPGTSLATSDEIGGRVERMLLAQPEVVATARRTGRAELDPHAQNVFASEIDVTLRTRERSRAALLAALRREFAAVPGTNIVLGQPISHRIDHMLSGAYANIAISIFGEDLYELRRLGSQVERAIGGVRGAVDVAMEEQSEIPLVTVRFDRAALAAYGMTVAAAAESLETAFTGTVVGRIRDGEASFDLVVRYPERAAADLETLRHTLLTLPSGALVPFASLGEIRHEVGPNAIGRQDVQRRLMVMANVAGRDLVGVVDDMRTAIAAEVALPPGYRIEFGGQYESATAAAQRLQLLTAAVIAGIFLLLVSALGSVRDAGLVMLNLPLALIGGVAGVWLAGGVVTIAALIGFVTLFGIATRNGVILVDHIGRLRREHGLAPEEAVRRGAQERLVPILMTALATALALVPLALSQGQPGSEILAPMALVILAGLLTSTALNMLVVPAIYLRFGSASADVVTRGGGAFQAQPAN